MPSSLDGQDAEKLRDQNVKLGLLLVNLGVAPQNEVFPGGSLPTVPLTVSAQGPNVFSRSSFRRVWYNPLTWFGDFPRSPPQQVRKNAENEPSHHAAGADSSATLSRLAADSSDRGERNAAAVATAATTLASAATMEPFVFTELTPAEVATLEESVRKDREKLMALEASIHGMLDSIEETKRTYLTPARSTYCDDEVERVTQCYERANLQVRAAGKDALLQQRAGWILQCGASVDRLVSCTDRALNAYVDHTSN